MSLQAGLQGNYELNLKKYVELSVTYYEQAQALEQARAAESATAQQGGGLAPPPQPLPERRKSWTDMFNFGRRKSSASAGDSLAETRKELERVMSQIFEVPGGIDPLEHQYRRDYYNFLKHVDVLKTKLATLDAGVSSLDASVASTAKGKDGSKDLDKARQAAGLTAGDADAVRASLVSQQHTLRADIATFEVRANEAKKMMVERRFAVLDARLSSGDRQMLEARRRTVELNQIISLPLSMIGFH